MFWCLFIPPVSLHQQGFRLLLKCLYLEFVSLSVLVHLTRVVKSWAVRMGRVHFTSFQSVNNNEARLFPSTWCPGQQGCLVWRWRSEEKESRARCWPIRFWFQRHLGIQEALPWWRRGWPVSVCVWQSCSDSWTRASSAPDSGEGFCRSSCGRADRLESWHWSWCVEAGRWPTGSASLV